ncbi:rab-GTPase-TBC domain-containing protein, partial [Phakopsora pachyrhizi]
PITPKLSVQAPSPTSSSNGNPELEVPQIKVIQNQSTEENLNFTYRDLLTRLLAVWSALNPGIGYVQGMNHIGAVLIYVFSQSDSKTQHIRQERVRSNDPYHSDERVDDDSDHFENVEADAFWAFNSLMSPIRDLFIKSFDSDQSISRPSQMSPGVQSSLGFARVLSRYKSQLFRMEPDLAKRFESIDLDPRDYLIDWLGCLFCRCFHLPDLVRIWDSILAIKLDTSTHQAQRMSEEVDSNQVLDYLVDLSCVMTLKVKQMPEFHDVSKIEFDEIVQALQNFREQADVNVDQIIQESLLLRQQRLAEDLNDDLPLGSFGKAQKTSLEEENEDEPHWEEDIDEGGWDEYEGPRIGASINSLASRFAWTSSSQQKPQLDLSVPQKRDSLQENKNLTDEQPSLLAKLMSKAEGWKDSDAAATFSKKATNWTILASSWRPPSLISDMNSVDSNSNNISGIGGAREAYIKASENGTAWSKHSYTSTVSGDSSVQLPAMSSNTSSDQASSSCSSPPLGSPLRSNHFNSNGPRPLLLSSRVRTNVITEN